MEENVASKINFSFNRFYALTNKLNLLHGAEFLFRS